MQRVTSYGRIDYRL